MVLHMANPLKKILKEMQTFQFKDAMAYSNLLWKLRLAVQTMKFNKNAAEYWDLKWRFDMKSNDEPLKVLSGLGNRKSVILSYMKLHNCVNVLEVGCGTAFLRSLPNYVGLDISKKLFKRNDLKNAVCADITKAIPFKNETFDLVITGAVLVHIPYSHIDFVSNEIRRVAKKLIILQEPPYDNENKPRKSHCFNHNLRRIFESCKVPLIFL